MRRIALVVACAASASWSQGLEPFTEEAVARGIDLTPTHGDAGDQGGRGVAFVDLDGDGDPDVVALGAPGDLVAVFENDGTGHFVDRTGGTGIGPVARASGVCAADYDGDGDLDLFVTAFDEPDALLRNEGGFAFTSVGAAAGVAWAGGGEGAAFGDYDADGWVDLYVASTTQNRLYHNLGNETFEEVGEALGVALPPWQPTFQPVFLDYDLDGDSDLYISNDRGQHDCETYHNYLFENIGGAFDDVTASAGAEACINSMGIAVGDYNADGLPDLYATNGPPGNVLLINQGDGTFAESADDAGVGLFEMSWGTALFDCDNDGILDLYVCAWQAANALYRHDGAWPAADVAPALGIDVGGKSFCLATGDVDRDGDLDLLLQNDAEPIRLFINHEGARRRWLELSVVGRGANTGAIGATVVIEAAGRTMLREVAAGGNFKSQNELLVHAGLGGASVADGVAVTWPGGVTRAVTGVPADARWSILPPEALGDADGDGDVDATDYQVFFACFEPGGAPVQPGCEVFDLTGDWVVDEADWSALVAAMGGCPGDANGDGALNILDFVAFQVAFQAGDAAADCTGDGALNVLDFVCFQGVFSLGCP